ncbi:Transcriptional regulator [Flavobacterium sp. 9AF]|uniref:FMN-binding negative transcriptional regulator n=1 Tax=Flavobacterium sp. 9AF TaxID=2653142 RepID=UPI0012F1ADC6|nr:FMN-binding negative transcriptional regulator [Flavobacterium sp. 9AF]VXB60127.1 Transcriptional regulator [Flavobacterium sp. 9AF]
MYIPKVNLATDKNEILEFMKRFSFATIITSKDNFPTATHLPFVATIRENKIVLTSHFAKANEHWQTIENNTVLVIFSEPHAYISTKNYDKELNVPTWNYISVHAYGQGKIITETDQTFEVIESTIKNYEATYLQKWAHFSEDYKLKMSKGIVAFEILVTDLQAKMKLSQNRTNTEQRNIINTLSKSTDTNEVTIAEYMKYNLSKK